MDQRDLVKYTVEVLDKQGLAYMLVGSFASGAYGEPRSTFDLDIVLDLFDSQIGAFAAAFPSPDFYLSVPAVREAVLKRDQFNVIHFASGYKVDFMLVRRDAWGHAQLGRRHRVPILSDQDAFAASAEDIIIGKLWYFDDGGSEKHLRDIAGILRMRGDHLDRAYIEHWADELGYRQVWDAIVERERAD